MATEVSGRGRRRPPAGRSTAPARARLGARTISATEAMMIAAADERPPAERLAEDDRPEQDRDDRVHVRVGADERGRRHRGAATCTR